MRRPTSERKRNSYLGGHDASAILGLNPYASAGDVYAKVVCGHEVEQTPRMLRGLIVEPGMIDYVRGQRQQPAIENDCFFLDDRVPFFGGSVDGVESPRVIHEIKSTLAHGWGGDLAERWGPTNSDDVERSAWLQCQWYMGITGARETHVWLLILDDDEEPRHYTVARDDGVIRTLRDAAEAFWWDHVVLKVPPSVACISSEAAQRLHPVGVKGLAAEVTDSIRWHAEAYALARATAKAAELAKQNAGAILKGALGEAEHCKWSGGSITWRARTLTMQTNWEAVAYELARKATIDGSVFNGIVRENSHRPWSSRALTVTITDPNKTKPQKALKP
jgi:putative phage-type endonuclease